MHWFMALEGLTVLTVGIVLFPLLASMLPSQSFMIFILPPALILAGIYLLYLSFKTNH